MILPSTIRVYGDVSFRGKCQREEFEQISIISQIRRTYPNKYGKIVIHPRNEGLLSKGQLSSVAKRNAEGMTKGASDVIVPGSPAFVCEIKRRDHTQSKWQDGQIEYLEAAQSCGAFVCVALGAQAAWQAFEDWRINYAESRPG